MQDIKLYGIQSTSNTSMFMENVYFYKITDAMEVCRYFNKQERNQRLNRQFLPFSTTLQTLEHNTKLVDNDRFRNVFQKNLMRYKLGINDYKIYESAIDYFAEVSAQNSQEESSDFVM